MARISGPGSFLNLLDETVPEAGALYFQVQANTPASVPNAPTAPYAQLATRHEIVFPTMLNEYTL
jgi:hypothetical protein